MLKWEHVEMWPLDMWPMDMWPSEHETTWTRDHVDTRQRGHETTWTWDHVGIRQWRHETTWIWDHVDMRPRGHETTWIWEHVDNDMSVVWCVSGWWGPGDCKDDISGPQQPAGYWATCTSTGKQVFPPSLQSHFCCFLFSYCSLYLFLN